MAKIPDLKESGRATIQQEVRTGPTYLLRRRMGSDPIISPRLLYSAGDPTGRIPDWMMAAIKIEKLSGKDKLDFQPTIHYLQATVHR